MLHGVRNHLVADIRALKKDGIFYCERHLRDHMMDTDYRGADPLQKTENARDNRPSPAAQKYRAPSKYGQPRK